MDYTTLSEADQLLIARDTLRAKESDHFRLTIAPDAGSAGRLDDLATQIEDLKKVVADLEAKQEQPPAKPKARARRTAKKDD